MSDSFGESLLETLKDGRHDLMQGDEKSADKAFFSKVDIPVNAVFVDIKVKYYPNYEASPEYFLTQDVSNED